MEKTEFICAKCGFSFIDSKALSAPNGWEWRGSRLHCADCARCPTARQLAPQMPPTIPPATCDAPAPPLQPVSPLRPVILAPPTGKHPHVIATHRDQGWHIALSSNGELTPMAAADFVAMAVQGMNLINAMTRDWSIPFQPGDTLSVEQLLAKCSG